MIAEKKAFKGEINIKMEINIKDTLKPGEGNGYPLQYVFLKNSMDGGSWWVIVDEVAKSWT